MRRRRVKQVIRITLTAILIIEVFFFIKAVAFGHKNDTPSKIDGAAFYCDHIAILTDGHRMPKDALREEFTRDDVIVKLEEDNATFENDVVKVTYPAKVDNGRIVIGLEFPKVSTMMWGSTIQWSVIIVVTILAYTYIWYYTTTRKN